MERLHEVQKIIDAWELARLESYYIRIKEIVDRSESRMRNQEGSLPAASDLVRKAGDLAGTPTLP